jgi:hypothetical protein
VWKSARLPQPGQDCRVRDGGPVSVYEDQQRRRDGWELNQSALWSSIFAVMACVLIASMPFSALAFVA